MPKANIKNSLLLFISTLIANFVSYLLSFMAIKKLSIELLGEFNLAWQLISVLATIGIGVQLFTVKHISFFTSLRLKNYFLSTMKIILVAIFLINLFLTFLYSYLFKLHFSNVLQIEIICILGFIYHLFLGYFQGKKRFVSFSILTLSIAFSKLILIFFISSLNLTSLFNLYIFTLLIINIIFYLYLSKDLVLENNDSETKTFTIIKKLVLSLISSVSIQAFLALYLSLDLVIAGFNLNKEDLSIFSVGNFFTKIGFWLPQFFFILIFPEMNKKSFNKNQLFITIRNIFFINLAIALLIKILKKSIINTLLSEKYSIISGELWKFYLYGSLLFIIQIIISFNFNKSKNKLNIYFWLIFIIQIFILKIYGTTTSKLLNISVLFITFSLIIFLLFFSSNKYKTYTSKNNT